MSSLHTQTNNIITLSVMEKRAEERIMRTLKITHGPKVYTLLRVCNCEHRRALHGAHVGERTNL